MCIILKRKKQYQGFKTKEADYYCQSILFYCYLNLLLNIEQDVENILFDLIQMHKNKN